MHPGFVASVLLLLIQPAQTAAPPDQAEGARILERARSLLGFPSSNPVGLSLEAESRTRMGENDSSSHVRLELLAPDRIMRTTAFEPFPGTEVKRIETRNAGKTWVEVRFPPVPDNSLMTPPGGGGGRGMSSGGAGGGGGAPGGGGWGGGGGGGMGGGARGGRRAGGAGRGAPGSAGGPAPPDPANQPEMLKLLENDLDCLFLGLTLSLPDPVTVLYEGEAELSGRRTDVFRFERPERADIRLYLDCDTLRVVALRYTGVLPIWSGPPAGRAEHAPSPEPPAMRQVQLGFDFDDYRAVKDKKAGEIWAPFKISAHGNEWVSDQWTVHRVKLEPKLKASRFEQKK